MFTRRKFLETTSFALAGQTLLAQGLLPAWAQSMGDMNHHAHHAMPKNTFDLNVEKTSLPIGGQPGNTITVNGELPAPLLRWREGDEVTLNVTNHMDEPTSIHWHGILLPFNMDGVPGVSYPGIMPGETFTYRFPVRQAGTYWYHSHSGLQEQSGHYGPLIIDPRDADPVDYDREYVVVLSDWTFMDPHHLFSKLKKMADYSNYNQRTIGDFFDDIQKDGLGPTLSDRAMWGGMRMNPTDISDVTGAVYTYLMNGHTAGENWTALFAAGERIRLRFINASAMTFFNVRIPGLPMTVVQADGLNIKPVQTDEFQIGVAETYDVVITPDAGQAYTLMCENADRSGYVRGTISPRQEMTAEVPPLREPPLLSMRDMGMDHGEMGDMDHSAMGHNMPMPPQAHNHATGPGVANTTNSPLDRLSEPGIGLDGLSHRTLNYRMLESLEPIPDRRRPGREVELHLTGNMERYMWSFDGVKFNHVAEPIHFEAGERVRLTLVNDTMMAHPIHLHGMFFDVVTGAGEHSPRKHTISVKPAEKLSVDVTADAMGEWAFHCHLLYHMHAGMMQTVMVGGKSDA